jgi:hypothetical protein
METLEWQNFKAQLSEHPNHHLQFEYAENSWIRPSFHITEIKQATITSVDCGGKMNAWTEVIVQVWEPESEDAAEANRPMKVAKALSIIELVERSLPINPKASVKIEFGNTQFDTRQLLTKGFRIVADNLIVDLRPDTVQCKAIERGQSCGTDASGAECCAPIKTEKPQIQLLNIVEGPCCTPGSGCC